MKQYIKKLMESLFDDTDDIFNDDSNENSQIFDANNIIDSLLNGHQVYDDELELVCDPVFQYKVKDYKELSNIINKIKVQLFKDDIHEFNLNWLNISNVNKLDYLLQFKSTAGDKFPIFWHVENWVTSQVTRMKEVFRNQKQICDLSNWNTSHVCIMENMFADCYEYDGNNGIENWDVHNVEFFMGMFDNGKKFNGNITRWNTENALDMTDMFNHCSVFNQDISNWNVQKVEHMDNMFNSCSLFNQPIQKWNLTNIKTFKNLLLQCTSFDQDFSGVDLRKYDMSDFAFFDKGTPMSKKGNSGRILNEWDFLKLGYDRGTFVFNVDEFEYGYGDENDSYAKIYNVKIDKEIQNLTDNDYYFLMDDALTLDGLTDDTYEEDDCMSIDVLTYDDLKSLYDVCNKITINDTKYKGKSYPDMRILIKNKVLNDLWNLSEIIDKSNINYYINRELLSLDITKDNFNNETNWNIEDFINFLYTVPNEIKKYKQKYG